MFSHHSRPLSAYFLMIGRYAPQLEPYVMLPPVTYAVSGAMVSPKFDGICASTPSMIRIRFDCDADNVLMFPLPVSPVSMSMSIPSKLYAFRIGTTVATNRSATVDDDRSIPAAAPPMDIRSVAPAAFAAHISAGVDTLTPASIPFSHNTVPSDRITGKAALMTL